MDYRRVLLDLAVNMYQCARVEDAAEELKAALVRAGMLTGDEASELDGLYDLSRVLQHRYGETA
jgi:uncharacterized protein YutE (UPF0331/DUF86 family)